MNNQHRWDLFINHLISNPADKPKPARENVVEQVSNPSEVSEDYEPWKDKEPKYFDKSGKNSQIICATCGAVIHNVNIHVQWHQKHGDLE